MYGLVYTYDSTKGAKIDPSVALTKMNDIDTEHEQLWGNWQCYLANKTGTIWNLDQTMDSSALSGAQLRKFIG